MKCPGCALRWLCYVLYIVEPVWGTAHSDRGYAPIVRVGGLPTLAKVGGSQSSICSGCATASVTMSAMLMVPRSARTTALRFLQSTAAVWTFLQSPWLQDNLICRISQPHLPPCCHGASSIKAATFCS